jgi:hypothetical protein
VACVWQAFLEVLRNTPLPTHTTCPAEVGLVERFITCGGVNAKALIKAALKNKRTIKPEGTAKGVPLPVTLLVA